MKIIFFFTLLINITFFLWEHRKGAPEIYLPTPFAYSTANSQKITLQGNRPEFHEQRDKGTNSASEQPLAEPAEQAVVKKAVVTQENNPPQKTFSACYLLQEGANEPEILTQIDQVNADRLVFTEQQVPYINNYLVLTLPAESLQQAESQQQMIKDQGISDLWLFKQGGFKWRISLGLFNSSAEANAARQQFARFITQPLAVVPDVQTHAVIHMIISAQEKELISTLESKLSQYIDKQVACGLRNTHE